MIMAVVAAVAFLVTVWTSGCHGALIPEEMVALALRQGEQGASSTEQQQQQIAIVTSPDEGDATRLQVALQQSGLRTFTFVRSDGYGLVREQCEALQSVLRKETPPTQPVSLLVCLSESELGLNRLNSSTRIVLDLVACGRQVQDDIGVVLLGSHCPGTSMGGNVATDPSRALVSCPSRAGLADLAVQVDSRAAEAEALAKAEFSNKNDKDNKKEKSPVQQQRSRIDLQYLTPELTKALVEYRALRTYHADQVHRYQRNNISFSPSVALSLFLMPILMLIMARAIRVRAQMLAAQEEAMEGGAGMYRFA